MMRRFLLKTAPGYPLSTHLLVPSTGIALGLLDEWLSGCDPNAPTDLAAHTRLPAAHGLGNRPPPMSSPRPPRAEHSAALTP